MLLKYSSKFISLIVILIRQKFISEIKLSDINLHADIINSEVFLTIQRILVHSDKLYDLIRNEQSESKSIKIAIS